MKYKPRERGNKTVTERERERAREKERERDGEVRRQRRVMKRDLRETERSGGERKWGDLRACARRCGRRPRT